MSAGTQPVCSRNLLIFRAFGLSLGPALDAVPPGIYHVTPPNRRGSRRRKANDHF